MGQLEEILGQLQDRELIDLRENKDGELIARYTSPLDDV